MNDPAAYAQLNLDTQLLSRIEDAGLNASAPPQQRWLDGWLVRFSAGKAKRARCINPVACGRLPVAEKLRLAEPVYCSAGLALIVRVTPFSQPSGIDDELARMGFKSLDDTCVMVASFLPETPVPVLAPGCTLEPTDPHGFARAVGELRGSDLAQRTAHAERLMWSPVPYHAWLVRRHGAIVACAQYAVEAEMVGLYDVFTAPAARGQGLARMLCAQLLQQASTQGARIGYLQVDSANAAARAVYAKLGFVDAYRYHYRAIDPSAA